MTRYNTGNPLGSTDPRDLYDNAENLDAGINGPGHTWDDRFGQPRASWAGIENRFNQFLADGSTIEFPTWDAASAAAGSAQIPNNRQVAVVGDSGTHVDPVTGETVNNSGRYVMSSAGLQWVSPDVLSQKLDKEALGISYTLPNSATPWENFAAVVGSDNSGELRVFFESSNSGVFAFADNPVSAEAGSKLALNALGFSSYIETADLSWMPTGAWVAYDESSQLRVIFADGEFLGMGDVAEVTGEVINARGNVQSLGERLDSVIDANGLPTYSIQFPEFLRNVRSRIQRIKNGEQIQCDIAIGPGDSWTFVRGYWSENFANSLVSLYGDGGGGWVGFGWPQAGSVGNGNARGSLYGYDAATSAAQGWTCGYASTATIDASPDGCMVTSNGTAGKVLTGTYPASPAVSGGRLFYRGYGDNPVIDFSWNGETATQLTLSGTGVFAIDIPAPTSSGAGSWAITTVSGTARLFGLNLLSAAKGVRIHKLAASGSASFGWGNTSTTFGDRLRAGFGLLSPHVIAVMLGVNDSKSGRTVEQYIINMSALIANLRAGAPSADIILMSQPEISSPGTTPIAGYRQALKLMAHQNRCAYVDLQPSFGPVSVDYGPEGVVPLLISDGIHPNNGGSAIVQAELTKAIGA